MQRCQENGWPLPRRCWPHRLARKSAFARRLRDSAAGPGGGGSGGTDPAHLPATVADPARPQADYSGNGESRTPHVAVAEDAGQPNAPMSRPGSSEWKARYPAGYGDEPPPDFLGRRSWHLISTYGGGVRPKAGELWRFLVDATPGSSRTEDKRWVEVRILPGQEQYLFAARPELRIPGTAPMTYVDDPTPTTVPCWSTATTMAPGTNPWVFAPSAGPRRVGSNPRAGGRCRTETEVGVRCVNRGSSWSRAAVPPRAGSRGG